MSEELTFGSWLRQRRKGMSITQEELAERLGISGIALRKLESGERRPSGQIALLLADYFRVPDDEHQAFVAFARIGKHVSSGDVSPTAPWRSALVFQTNLPAMLTPLIGREEAEAAVLDHLLNSKTRLLTLIGPPGIGKTRLGLQVAFDLLTHFEDGVHFVDLAPITEPEMVLPAIARILGLKETASQPLESLLLDYIRQRRMLLLLDNFEQVLDASTEVVKLLEASPWLKVLITSREALQVRGERRFLVPPLAVPDLKHLPALDKLAGYPSVELFVERAQAVASGFTLDAANAQDVAAVCIGLEGLPLAIELAASRAKWLSPAEMRLALTSRLKLLRAETRDLPARHRTLREAIKWSYDLLSQQEQRLFRMLSVFVGGFTPDAAEAVHSARENRGDGSPILDTFYLLVERSLVRQDSRASGSDWSIATAAGARFGMWEAIHEFASDELRENGELRAVERAHALYYARLAREAAPHLLGAEQAKWLDRLEQEHNNLQAALRWAVETSERYARYLENTKGSESNERGESGDAAEIGLRLAVDLLEFWRTRGYASEGRAVLKGLISVAERLGSSIELRVEALNVAGALESIQGDYGTARSLLEQALAIGKGLGDKANISSSLHFLGNIASDQADYAAARLLFGESLMLRRELGDARGTAMTLNNLGLVIQEQGDYQTAFNLYEESLALFRQLGDKEGIGHTLGNLGNMAANSGDYQKARALQEETLLLRREVGDKSGMAYSLVDLGTIALMEGDSDRAHALFDDSLALWREIGDRWSIAFALYHLAKVAHTRDDYATARAFHEESLAIQRELGNKQGIAWSVAGLGAVSAESGEGQRGARLLGAATAIWEAIDALPDTGDRMVLERGVASARAQLAEDDFESAWAEGRSMNLGETITYALQGIEPPFSGPTQKADKPSMSNE